LKETLEKLDAYLAEVEAQDRRDDQAHGAEADAESLPQKLRWLQTRRAKLQRALEAVKKHRRRGQPTRVYRGRDCASCPVREQCTTDRQGARPLEVHRPCEPIRRAKERLRSEEGQALYKERKSTVEAVLGQWQHNRGVRRLRLRGLSGCDIELHLLAIGHNVKKFWKQGVTFSVN
jgi:hypothetical protein